MELIVLCSDLIRICSIVILTYFAYVKITNYKNNNIRKNIFIILTCLNISMIYVIFEQCYQPLVVMSILCILYALIIHTLIIGKSFNYIAYVVALINSYIIFLVGVLISGIILWFCTPSFNFKNAISLITIPIIEMILYNMIFRIKRVKNGFNFLNNIKVNTKLIKLTMIFTACVLLYFELLQRENDIILNSYLIFATVLTLISLFIWIKTEITKTYKNHMRDRTIEMQKAEIDEQARIMEELKAENLKLASAVHKYNKKFSSLEFAMKNLEANTEFSDELSVIIDETKEAAKNFAKEVEATINKLPLTNNVGIDNMFKYMQEEARKKDINFDLKLNISINPLLETTISKDKFETLIGDHLKDAIIAVDKSEKLYKSILVTIGLVDGIYEFSVYDTGIEFEIDTLLKLGKEQVTTHKDEGGSGIGFITTFETLKECKASLVIEEYNPKTTNYTKAVIIKFDGKNEYRICSYRAEEIKEQKTKRRIIIEKLK